MIRFITFIALTLSCLPNLEAQSRKFPYEAVVTENETYVRSGPGSRYYPTSRLSEGARVIVHRHDPGGWYMIDPPPGSFSWIRAEYVQTADNKNGQVTENQVVVRVGSTFGEKREVEQKRLSRGDRVTILGEQSFSTPEGLIHMYKIAPPRGEYRWVPGQFLAAADSITKRMPSGNPFEEVAPQQPQPKAQKDPFKDPFSTPGQSNVADRTDNPGVIRTDKPQATKDEVTQLAKLDTAFRTMVRKKTAEWNFSAIEAGYQELAGNASTDHFKDQLDQRFGALAKYQKIKDQYDDFLRLTQETAQRDAQILSNTGTRPAIVSPTPTPPSQVTTPQPGKTPKNIDTNDPAKMSGAGLIQRAVIATPNAPQFVLVSPRGEILAFLGSKSVDLSQHLGKPRGIFGKRGFRTDLQADYIEVEAVTPVRLKR